MAGSASGELIVITPANLTIGSVIADNGGATALTKAGSATLTLTGSNTYSGVTTIGAGTLQVGNGGASGTWAGHGDRQRRPGFQPFRRHDLRRGHQRRRLVDQDGRGTLVLSGSNSYSGGTTIGQGTLQLANSAALLNSTVAINADNGLQFSPGSRHVLPWRPFGRQSPATGRHGQRRRRAGRGGQRRIDDFQRPDQRRRLLDQDGQRQSRAQRVGQL